MTEKRSSTRESAQLDLLMPDLDQGVGARQASTTSPRRGGGYRDVCTTVNFQKKRSAPQKSGALDDPRFAELRRMGLQRVWLEVASAIGVDAFLMMWRILDGDPVSQQNETYMRVRLRRYRSYLRFQRNRLIETLASQGVEPHEIRRRLEQQLGEKLSLRHIQRHASEGKL